MNNSGNMHLRTNHNQMSARHHWQSEDDDGDSLAANDVWEDNVTHLDQSGELQEDDVPQKILVSPR